MFAWDTAGHCTVGALMAGGTLHTTLRVLRWVVGHCLVGTRKQRRFKTVNCQLLSYLTVTSFIFATNQLITQVLLDIFLKII